MTPDRGKEGTAMFETERLVLRRWEESDADSLYEYARDPAVGPIAGWPPHRSVEESLKVIGTVLSGREAYAVCLKTDNRAIGAIELKLNGHTDMTESDNECEMGYWIGRPFWGRGLIPEAVREMLRHAFEDLRMTRVWIGYYEGNDRSRRVQEKCGFRYGWRSEDVDVPLMGETRVGHVSSITKAQWLRDRRLAARDGTVIGTERLLLREYTMNDFDALYEIMSDEETMRHYPKPFDKDKTRGWIAWNLDNYEKYGFGLWAVTLKETGEFIGDCGITLQNIDGETLPEIGYHIHKKYWRRGFAKEAARAVRDWVFENTDCDAVWSYMKYTNAASYSTALANGMKKVKEYPDPKNTISYAYAITREEWEGIKNSEQN